jgi:hypothetical protein
VAAQARIDPPTPDAAIMVARKIRADPVLQQIPLFCLTAGREFASCCHLAEIRIQIATELSNNQAPANPNDEIQ